MRRKVSLLLAVGSLLLMISFNASAGPNDAIGCRDITAGDHGYTTHPLQIDNAIPPLVPTSLPVVDANWTLAAPGCADVVYTLTVLNEDGTITLGQQSRAGDGSDHLTFAVKPIPPTTTVCVYGTTSDGSGEIDRAPDVGCVTLVLNGAASGYQFH